MNKKIALLAASESMSIVLAVFLIISGSNIGSHNIEASTSMYKTVLDANNGGDGFTSSYSSSTYVNTSAKTNLGNQLNITYSNAKKETNYFVNLQASNGYIYNSTILNTLSSIKVTYEGSSLSLYTSENTTFSGGATSLTSGTAVEISGGFNYFKISNSGSSASKINKIEVSYTCVPSVKTFNKITSQNELKDGKYLLVCENNNVAFDGSRTTLDASGNKVDVTIKDSTIEYSSALEAKTFTYNSSDNTLQSSSGYYIGKTANANGLDSSTTTKYTNTITFSNGDAVITASGGCTLRYNKESNQTRFRYYKSGQTAVQLYLLGAGGDTPTSDTYKVTINKSNSGLSGTASTSALNRSYTLDDNKTQIGVTFGAGAYNTDNDYFRLNKNSYLASNCDVKVKKVSVDFQGLGYNYVTFTKDGSTVVEKEASSETASGTRYDYAINSSEWKLTASNGYANIYSVTIYCEIQSGPVAVSGVNLSPTSLTLYTDTGATSSTLVATVLPENATNKAVNWESSNPSVATVDDGVVTSVGSGSATITVTTVDGGYTATCSVTVVPYIHVSSVTLDKESASTTVGNAIALTANVSPTDAANKNLTWSSNNTSVATVNNGSVSAVGVGQATITVTSVDNLNAKDTFILTVNPTPAESISLDKSELSLKVGQSETLTATVLPTTTTDPSVTWTSSNPSVASVSDGVVTGVSASENPVTITAKTTNDKTATCSVTVSESSEPIVGSEFELVTDVADLAVGDYVLIGCKGNNKVAGSFYNRYLSSIDATFANNKVSLTEEMNIIQLGGSSSAWTLQAEEGYLKSGSNALYVNGSENDTWTISISGDSASICPSGGSNLIQYNSSSPRFAVYSGTQKTVELYHQSGRVTGVSLDETNIGVNVNQTYQLHASVLPEKALDKSVTWLSSQPSVATVDTTGLVKGISEGEANITVKTTDGGYTATCKVVVQSGSVIVPTSVELFDTSISLSLNGTKTLTANVLPSNATNKNVTWSSSNSAVATVSSSGLVTAKATGNATITATTVSGGKTATCSVEVVTTAKVHLNYTYEDYSSYGYYESDICPLEGSPKLLIIPIWFTDSSTFISTSKKESVRNDIQKTYLGTNSETGWRSVKTFYEEESFGKVSLTGTVSEWYEVGESFVTYAPDDTGGTKTETLATTAADWYFNNHKSESRKDYDTNGDGYLDGVMLIYGAPDYDAYGNDDYGNLWAYCYWTDNNPSTSSPTTSVFFWASYDFMYGSNATSRTGQSSYYSGDTSHCTLDAHTFTHEMGHVFGLDDYYDYANTHYSPAGGFSMQDYNVGGHDPYSVMAYGWADPYIPTSSMSITVGDFQSTHDMIILANHSVNSPFDEYLILEYFTPTGLNELDCKYQYSSSPKGPTTSGIRLWHVDARLTYKNGNKWSTSLVTNPTIGDTLHAFVNTYADSDYGSKLGSAYYDYNLIQLIRNDTSISHKTTTDIRNSDLFGLNTTFSMSTYKSQFVKLTNMNNGSALGWTFKVTALNSSSATIQLTKV